METKLPSAVMRMKRKIEEQEAALQNPEVVAETPEVEAAPEVPQEPVAKPQEPKIEPKPALNREDDPDYWKHRFKTLEGITKAESARDKELIRTQNEKLSALEASLVEIEKRIPRQFDLRKYLSEEEIDTLDERQLQAAIKIAVSSAEEGFESRIKKHVAPLQDELKRAQESAFESRKAAFWTTIATAVPDYIAINESKEWLSWLGETDPVSGFVRDEILQNAQNALDGQRVVAVFKAFLKEKELANPVRRLERKVVPETPSTQVELESASAASMSRSDIRKFYADVSKGYYRGRQKELEAMERKIDAAQRANAIY